MDALDAIVIGGRSKMLIDIEITGKGAHSGMEPEKGISAIKAASLAIATLKDGRIDPETTANFGTIQGGLIRNGAPEKCSIKAEVRSLNHEKCIALSNTYKEVLEVISRSIGAKAKVNLNLAYKAMRISEDTPMVQVAKKALKSVGIEPKVLVLPSLRVYGCRRERLGRQRWLPDVRRGCTALLGVHSDGGVRHELVLDLRMAGGVRGCGDVTPRDQVGSRRLRRWRGPESRKRHCGLLCPV